MSNKGKYKFTYSEMAKALVKANGIRTLAAKMLGCDYHTVTNYIKKSKLLKKVIWEIKNNVLDTCENKVLEAINRGDMDAVWRYLKYHGRKRGYTDKQEIDIKIDVTKLSDEEIDYAVKTGKLPNTNLTPVNRN